MPVRRRTVAFLLALHAALVGLVWSVLVRRARERRVDDIRSGTVVLRGGPYTLTTDEPIVVTPQTSP